MINIFKLEIQLTTRSLELLSFNDEFSQSNYIFENKMESLVMYNYIVCMTTIKKINEDQAEGVDYLIVGTEGKYVFVINGSEMKISTKFKIDGIPNAISAYGAFETDYRIYISCRNEIIYSIRNGEIQKTFLQVSSKILNLIRLEKALYVACMNSYFHSYNVTGKKVFSVKQPSEIFTFEKANLKQTRKLQLLLLGLRNGEVRLYNDKVLIGVCSIPETIFGMKFGKLGKLDECLVLLSDKGSIYVKSLEKSINLETLSYKKQFLEADETSLNVPKKTTLFLELMEREKEYYKSK